MSLSREKGKKRATLANATFPELKAGEAGIEQHAPGNLSTQEVQAAGLGVQG